MLSAGCSSGEEAYTLAMILYDSGLFFWNWDVLVTGMDVDSAALEKARRAVYHPNSFRSIRPADRREALREGAGRGAGQGRDPEDGRASGRATSSSPRATRAWRPWT